MKKFFTWILVASVLVTVARCAPRPKQEHWALDVFEDLQSSVSNLVDVASNRVENAVNRTTNIVNKMSNTLWETLRTRDKLQLLDQTEKLGGKLSSASTNFLDATSAVLSERFSDVFNSTYETLNTMFSTKANIANQFMDVTTNFVSRTGNLVSSWLDIESSMPSIQSDDQKTKRSIIATNLFNQSIGLVNSTNESLAKVINATSVLVESSIENRKYFVDTLINSTARILGATTDSLGKLLDSTNHLIEDVISANQETAILAYNATTKLLNATSETVKSFLKATALLICDAANTVDNEDDGDDGDDGEDEPTIRALHATKHALSKIFNSTTTLMQGVINKHKHVLHHVVDTTGNFLEASIDVKSNIFTKTIDFGKKVKKGSVHLVANKLQSAANKLVSALDHMEQHFEQSDSTQSKPQAALDQVEHHIDQAQSQSSSQVNDAQSPEVIAPVDVQTEPIIQIENQTELQAPEIGYDSSPPTVDSPAESVPTVV